jgi:hypothetical protein
MPRYNEPSTNTAAANTDVIIDLAAIAADGSNSSDSSRRTIKWIAWSLSADPGSFTPILTVESPAGTKLFEVDITKGGPGFMEFPNDGIPGASGQVLRAKIDMDTNANCIATLNIMEGSG